MISSSGKEGNIMSIFAFLGGRHDRKAWGRALFAAGCRLPEKFDKEKYSKATAQIIKNDCKIIQGCADALQTAASKDERKRHQMVLYSRFTRLSQLQPYATREQKKQIRQAKEITRVARRLR